MLNSTRNGSPGRARSLFDKIWAEHLIDPRSPGVPGGPGPGAKTSASAPPAARNELLAIDRIFLHERTGSIALKKVHERACGIMDPARVFGTIDHIVDTRPGRGDATLVPNGRAFIVETREAARAAGIRLFDVDSPDQGIVHVVSPELGLALPGLTIVCPDSHTCTQGGIGAFAWGIGSSDAEHALVTGTLRLSKPKTLRVRFEGRTAAGVTAKDLSLKLLAEYGAGGGEGHVVEYAGAAVRALDVEARLTLCNMTTEFSAMTGLIAPDEVTFAFLATRRFAPSGPCWDLAVEHWRALRSDEDAVFDREIRMDASAVSPMVTWGTSPQHAVAVDAAVPEESASRTPHESYARAIDYMGLAPGTPMSALKIDAAFIGSCTNSRLSDLRSAARILDGRRVAPGVRALVVPGSSWVKRQAEAEGLDRIFKTAGFEWRESGCSLCFNAGGESFGRGQRVISSTNRNFEGRQGPAARTHLASPETVAASAVAGCISDARLLRA